MTVKTAVSRFQIHDELTAPDESAPLIKTIQATGGAVTKFVGVLAGAPAVLRAYTRMRSELRGGVLPQATRERIALAVAEHREDNYSIAQHAKSARRAGLGLDEVSRARSFTSGDPKEAALLLYLKEALDADGRPPVYDVEQDAQVLGRHGAPRCRCLACTTPGVYPPPPAIQPCPAARADVSPTESAATSSSVGSTASNVPNGISLAFSRSISLCGTEKISQ